MQKVRDADDGFGDRLREVRTSRRLTKADVARAAGVGWGTVNDWEKHGRLPTRPVLARLVKELHLTPVESRILIGSLSPVEPPAECTIEFTIPDDPTAADRREFALIQALTQVQTAETFDLAHDVLEALREGARQMTGPPLAIDAETAGMWMNAAAELTRRGAPITGATLCLAIGRIGSVK